MNSHELLSGDLIFYVNSLAFVEHIALYIGEHASVPYVVHATTGEYRAMMITRISPPDEGCSYRVMRPVNQTLAQEAKKILSEWVKMRVPFASNERRDIVVNYLDNIGAFDTPTAGEKQAIHGKKTYLSNYAWYFTMAKYLPLVPDDGLFCSEAIVAAFNVALLMQHAIETVTLEWTLAEGVTLEEFAAGLDNPLPFDARATLPAGIYHHCSHSPLHWENKGDLLLESSVVSDEESKAVSKKVWVEFKREFSAYATANAIRGRAFSPASPGKFFPVSPEERLARSPLYIGFFDSGSADGTDLEGRARSSSFI